MTHAQSSSEDAVRVILVPYPLNLLSAFAYYLLEASGVLSSHVFYRYQRFHKDEDSPTRLCLFGPSLFEKVGWCIDDDVPADSKTKRALHRISRFCRDACGQYRQKHDELQEKIARMEGSPRDILETCAGYFRELVEKGLDPFRDELPPFPQYVQTPASIIKTVLRRETFGKDIMHLSRPVYQLNPLTNRDEETGSTTIELDRNQARLLSGQHLTIGVVGQAGLGKSTITANLFHELEEQIRRQSRRSGWRDFGIKVRYLDADFGTPTLSAIMAGKAQDKEALRKLKRPWTMKMAVEAVRQVELGRSEANILLVDFPGKVDQITELLAAPLDGAILVTPSGGGSGSEETWGNLLDNTLGIELLAHIFSGKPGEESKVMRHSLNDAVRGQITRSDRRVHSYDRFYMHLAKVLLFNLLPYLVEQRYKALQKLAA